VSLILRLAYMLPTIVEAILDGKYPAYLKMMDLMEPFPMDWDWQAEYFFAQKPVHSAVAQG
jgi:hypothetical protein